MSPPRKKEKKEEVAKSHAKGYVSGIVRLEVENISKQRRSIEVEVGGFYWRLKVAKLPRKDRRTKRDRDFFIVFFGHIMKDELPPWSIDVTAECNVFNADNSQNNIQTKTLTVDHAVLGCCWEIIGWDEFIDEEKGFVKDDKCAIEIRFSFFNVKGIRPYPQFDFADPNEPRHDVALVIEGEKVYVSKQILAVHSPVFNAMFYGNYDEKDKKEIILNEVVRDEFIEMLRVIYPSCKRIRDESAEYLLKLGDQFDISSLMKCVERSLVRRSELSNIEKLRLADKYRLNGLLHHCFSEMKTEKDFNDVKESPIYDSLSAGTAKALFEKVLKLDKFQTR